MSRKGFSKLLVLEEINIEKEGRVNILKLLFNIMNFT